MKIKKAKLVNGLTLEVNYIDSDGNDITLKGRNKVHNDLKIRLAQLVPFLADLTEQREAAFINWYDLESPESVEALRKLDVTGVSLGGDETNPLATLVGRRTLATGKVLNLVAPATGFDMDNETYERCGDLEIAVKAFIYEAEQYITSRKWAEVQQEFDFEDGEDPFGDGGDAPEDVAEPADKDEVAA